MPAQSHPVGILVYGIDNQLLEGATVVLTLGSGTTEGISNSKGEVVLNTGNFTSWSVGDTVSITASKTGVGTKTQSLVLTDRPQRLSITLAETSDLIYHENTETNEYVLNFSLLTTYNGKKVTTDNPLPIKTQDPVAKFHLSDIARGDPEYWGYLDKDGNWYIMKDGRSAGTRRFARGTSDYSANFTNRANLTYSYFNEVF